MTGPRIQRRTCNLLVDGYDLAADHVKSVLRHGHTLQHLVVRSDGSIRLYRSWELPEAETPNVVGMYNARVSKTTLAGDLEERLREIKARQTA